MNVTREVVSDLWPLYTAGEASADSQALVEEFLNQDAELTRILRASADDSLRSSVAPSLSPEGEARAFCRTKCITQCNDWLHFLAVLFSCFALGRIIADTSFDVSPVNFIITASIAAGFWIAFYVRLAWLRRKIFQPRGDKKEQLHR